MRAPAALVTLLLCCAGSVDASPDQPTLQGRRLDEALRMLQRSGLAIVFSSEIVTPAMRVLAEPRAATPRRQLDELLEPHGLRAEQGPGKVIQVVRDLHTSPTTSAKASVPRTGQGPAPAGTAKGFSKEGGRYSERVTVTGSLVTPVDHGASEAMFDASDLRVGSSVLQDDGLRALHAMPQVTVVDDFRSEFSVRGSPYRHVGVVIDGVATPWLQHTVYGRRDAGSLSMFGSAIVERATLEAGAYPRRYDDTLGAQLELTLREGSRESKHFSGSAGGMSAAFVGEGPMGAGGRGSWIASVRNSYRTWPAKQLTPNDAGFAFADAHAKLVYDVTPTQQISMTALGGRSTLDGIDEPLPSPLGAGTNLAALASVRWRSALGPRTVVNQRISYVGQALLTTWPKGQAAGRSSNRALSYRGEVLRSLLGGTVEAGGEVRQLSGTRYSDAGDLTVPRDQLDAAWSERSTYAHFSRNVTRGVSLAGGVRASESTLVRDHAIAPWLLGEWSFTPGLTLHASVGAARQYPELDAVWGAPSPRDLALERATHVDVGIEHRLTNGVRWQATLFNRAESNVLRAPDLQPRLAGSTVLDPPGTGLFRNSLHGTSRGLELLVARDHAARLSGWLAYSYGMTRQTDISTQETFWGDFDRRHAFNAAGVFRVSGETSVGIVMRGASGVPVPGYAAIRDDSPFVSERRNEIRVPLYARLDARAQHAFVFPRRRMTVFAEMLNVLNRQNRGPADGVMRPLIPRRASIGIEIDLPD